MVEVAVIYEESYTLYDQHSERHIQAAVVRRPQESNEDFNARVEAVRADLGHTYSYYDVEYVYAE